MVISARYSSSNECCTWWLNSPLCLRTAIFKQVCSESFCAEEGVGLAQPRQGVLWVEISARKHGERFIVNCISKVRCVAYVSRCLCVHGNAKFPAQELSNLQNGECQHFSLRDGGGHTCS